MTSHIETVTALNMLCPCCFLKMYSLKMQSSKLDGI
ncbi:unnamed protein product [Amoebophrya sp. A25]|nr:unnamed protein product [Amoebophrya sp. A25]|eukprot:GSA25T00016462001.1